MPPGGSRGSKGDEPGPASAREELTRFLPRVVAHLRALDPATAATARKALLAQGERIHERLPEELRTGPEYEGLVKALAQLRKAHGEGAAPSSGEKLEGSAEAELASLKARYEQAVREGVRRQIEDQLEDVRARHERDVHALNAALGESKGARELAEKARAEAERKQHSAVLTLQAIREEMERELGARWKKAEGELVEERAEKKKLIEERSALLKQLAEAQSRHQEKVDRLSSLRGAEMAQKGRAEKLEAELGDAHEALHQGAEDFDSLREEVEDLMARVETLKESVRTFGEAARRKLPREGRHDGRRRAGSENAP
ncbi:MAG: hypothetical protein KGJ23_12440 [Euryarchaeota archaeon]|nr:hypothetical protein [Euryarchaeota archaeon]MDE1837406.1 hypothetical protein [Euryarchaeota archaeon]MDE1879911.1 hypothetical protein [Euryarchaeota archaeon]MDE2045494.1 hypothetical protein [Thermoplasmata archaeon]